ncbi:ABC transporter substrate-binding protein [Streptomyces sp. NPDC050560]|uniref:ABC transporter substrate-binding protein n=1 Tax=Streptomyces sp. NPDC050560 TaxID=3365630 RepID=UPI00379583D9
MSEPDAAHGRPSRRALLGAAGLAGAGLLAAGCTPVVRQVGSASGGARRGGRLVMAQMDDVDMPTLRQQNTPNTSWPRLVFNSLTAYDHRTLTPRPQLAADWDIGDGGRTVVLRLRDDVRFHSGRPFGPRDVAENIAYQASGEGAPGQLRSAASVVKDHGVTGRNEITLRLGHSITNFFDLAEIMMIVDHESIPELESGKVINGTGAFTFRDYSPGVSMTFRRNPRYWRAGLPRLDEVELRIVTEPQAIVASLQSGQTHLGVGLQPLQQRDIRADDRLRLIEADTRDVGQYIGCNVTRAPLDDKRVRQAIAWSVDRRKVRDMAMSGVGTTSCLPWAPTSPGYDERAAGHYHQDLPRARRLVEEAGARGAHLELTIRGNDSGGYRSIAEIVQVGLRAIGLDATIRPLQPAEFQQHLNTATFPGLWVAGHGFGQINPATLLGGAYPFNATKNASNFDSAEYRALAAKLWASNEPDATRRTVARVNAFLLDEQFVIDLVNSSTTFAVSRSVQGIAYSMFNYLVLDGTRLAEG